MGIFCVSVAPGRPRAGGDGSSPSLELASLLPQALLQPKAAGMCSISDPFSWIDHHRSESAGVFFSVC